MADPHSVLGLDAGATPEEIKRAYLLRAHLLHPDRHQGAPPDVLAEAERAMRQLTDAYDRLRGAEPVALPTAMSAPDAIEWILGELAIAAAAGGDPLRPDELARLRAPAAEAAGGLRFDRWLARRRPLVRQATAAGDAAAWGRAVRVLAEAEDRPVLLWLIGGTA